jgi:hypothetical protein
MDKNNQEMDRQIIDVPLLLVAKAAANLGYEVDSLDDCVYKISDRDDNSLLLLPKEDDTTKTLVFFGAMLGGAKIPDGQITQEQQVMARSISYEAEYGGADPNEEIRKRLNRGGEGGIFLN